MQYLINISTHLYLQYEPVKKEKANTHQVQSKKIDWRGDFWIFGSAKWWCLSFLSGSTRTQRTGSSLMRKERACWALGTVWCRTVCPLDLGGLGMIMKWHLGQVSASHFTTAKYSLEAWVDLGENNWLPLIVRSRNQTDYYEGINWKAPESLSVATLIFNHLCIVLSRFSHIRLFETVACQALLSMGFSRQGYFSVMCAVLCWVAQSCPAVYSPRDCSLPGSSVHGNFPGKNTGVGCHALPAMGSSKPRDRNQVSCIAGGFFTVWATREVQEYWSG